MKLSMVVALESSPSTEDSFSDTSWTRCMRRRRTISLATSDWCLAQPAKVALGPLGALASLELVEAPSIASSGTPEALTIEAALGDLGHGGDPAQLQLREIAISPQARDPRVGPVGLLPGLGRLVLAARDLVRREGVEERGQQQNAEHADDDVGAAGQAAGRPPLAMLLRK